jgi:RHS repeat-associated protein
VNGQSYTWDNNGNLTNDGVRSYTYDAANRLTAVSGSPSTSFGYDGLGNRITMTVSGATTRYALDVGGGLPEVIAETAGGQARQYVTGLAQYDSGTWAYQLPDALGSVRQLSNAVGQVTLAQSYDPFGNVLEVTGSGKSGFGYTGEQADGSTGLIFLRARYFDPATGRFINTDPFPGYANRPQTLNAYSYVSNNPVTLTDYSGLQGSDGLNDIVNRIVRRDPNGRVHGGVDALIKLFESDALEPYDPPASNTARARLELVLEVTNKRLPAGLDAGIQFAIDFNTCGLLGQFNDEWLYRKYWNQNPDNPDVANQVGHFLTAVRLGYNPSFLDTSGSLPDAAASVAMRAFLNVPSDEPIDVTAKRLIVGHEKVADPEPSSIEISGVKIGDAIKTGANIPGQYHSATGHDMILFNVAVWADRKGDFVTRDAYLTAILVSPRPEDWGSGNSLQDLRLSVKGWRLGRAVAGKDQGQGERTLITRLEVATWIRLHISVPYLPQILK